MKEIDFTGYIDANGTLQISGNDALKAAIKANPNTAVVGKISPFRNTISGAQRRYFFGVIADILLAFFKSTGVDCTKDDVVDLLKDRFLFREQMCPITGRYNKKPISLSDREKSLTREEFSEKKESIQRWAAESLNGLYIPDPDPNWRLYKNVQQHAPNTL